MIINNINKDLSEISSSNTINNNTSATISNQSSLSSSLSMPTTTTTTTTTTTKIDNSSSLAYIFKIRSLLDQVVSTYIANNTAKAKELATTAYLDNFENIEKLVGKNLSYTGKHLLRE